MTQPPPRLDTVRRRYGRLARVYDGVTLERLQFAPARRRAVELLDLGPSAVVVDVACGTGRNFELVRSRIGARGTLVGVDASPAMLARARDRAEQAGWDNVRTLAGDATELSARGLGLGSHGDRPADAVLCTLGLSVIPHWREAYTAMLGLVKPGGRVAVMDYGYPSSRLRAGLTAGALPLAWLSGRVAAGDCHRRPWLLVLDSTQDPTVELFLAGYVGVGAGTVR